MGTNMHIDVVDVMSSGLSHGSEYFKIKLWIILFQHAEILMDWLQTLLRPANIWKA